uniref:Sorting nexin-22 isoform X2 n=1 Tax=Geotrypetes seraphini TaxID=260995 RepID=A0A6P8NXL4_GEOSA|nr:sorting nexin-22 isoform X2 [Geotrypetes seraphini]XP_033775875.1 sorting nexin-22 isoform X2 [Geotrypetes seraphini]
MIEVYIPSVGQEVLHAEKTHTVFKVDVLFNGRKHSLQRRYSEFHALHKRFYRAVIWSCHPPAHRGSIRRVLSVTDSGYLEETSAIKKNCKVPDFPPKRVPNWMPKVLEQRRQGLEAYIQGVLCHNQDVPKELLEFLKVKHFQHSSKNCSLDSLTELSSEQNSFLLCHRPVVGFHKDPYVLPSCSELLPELVVTGVLEGHYRLGTSTGVKIGPKVDKLPSPR